MRRCFISFCLWMVLWLGISSFGMALDLSEQTVYQIKIEGNNRTERLAIINQMRIKIGQKLQRGIIREDVKRIFALGQFENIQIWLEPSKLAGKVILIVSVEEKPAIRDIRYKGNKELGESDLKEVVDLKKFAILDQNKINKNIEKIKNLYIEKGFYLAEVKAVLSKAKKASIVVTFEIRENSKIRIRQINFVGNSKVPSSVLKQYLQTSEHDLMSLISGRSTYQEALISRDVFFLQSYYLNHGYVKVSLGKPIVFLSPDKKSIYITYFIEEGVQYRYNLLDFSGDLVWPSEKMKKLLSLKKGELFNREKLYRENILNLSTLYQNRGFAYVNVVPKHKIDESKRLIDLTFHIEKGPKVKVERIEIIGNTTTQDKVIRREIRIYEGDFFNGTRIQISQQRVFALGFFEKNDPMYGIKVVKKRGSGADRIILQFVIKEKSTGTFQIGAGLSTQEGIIFNAQISKNNLFGRGQSLSLSAQFSGIRSNFQLHFMEPYFLDTRMLFDLTVFNIRQDFGSFFSVPFRQEKTGGSLTLGYPVWENRIFGDLLVSAAYRFEQVSVTPQGQTEQSRIRIKGFFSGVNGPSRTSSVLLTLRLDARNNRMFPTKGHLLSFSVEHADTYLGSENRFTRLTSTSRFYFSLPLQMVLRFNLNLGWITSPSPLGVPSFERYRLGGINSLRGYQVFTVGPSKKIPTSADGAYALQDLNWGGNKQLQFNTELEFPIIPKVKITGVLFFDAGNAYNDNEFFFQDRRNPDLPLGLYLSVGFGIRWFSPIGPLRFEWGIPLTPRPQDQSILFEFSIGNSF